jgi:hypothetical protein
VEDSAASGEAEEEGQAVVDGVQLFLRQAPENALDSALVDRADLIHERK